jgi:hypothetical protein
MVVEHKHEPSDLGFKHVKPTFVAPMLKYPK